MTKEQAKAMLPIIQAFAEGNAIQHRFSPDQEWSDGSNLNFESDSFNYRVKPEVKLRQWIPEEVPVGALFRWPESMSSGRLPFLITEVDSLGVVYFGSKYESNCNAMLYKDGEYSIDHGKTWLPCGI